MHCSEQEQRDMGYKAETVSATVSHFNFNFFLPAIQREFVWSTDKVIQLFDSLMRGYPITARLIRVRIQRHYGNNRIAGWGI
jgi:uncharacterized protein with ParB-like and HNH nuclease domain